MNNQDAQRYFDALSSVLRSSGLDWVVQQISEQIRLGKLEEREITPYRERDERSEDLRLFDPGPYGRGRKEKFQVVVTYTPKEKLSLLISAIQKLFTDTAEMQLRAAEYLFSMDTNANRVQFIGEESNDPTFVIALGENLDSINGHSAKLSALLATLKSEVGENDN